MEFNLSSYCPYADFVYFVDGFACINVGSTGNFYAYKNPFVKRLGNVHSVQVKNEGI